MLHSKFSWLLFLAPLLLVSCSGSKGPEGPPPPKTTKVGGVITIDGEPAPLGQIELKLYPKGREPKPGERIPKCVVGKEGKYSFSSYRADDGAQPGDYVLTLEWLRIAPGELFGPDKFLNNFNNPTANTDDRFQVTVRDGEPTEIPTIDIETSGLKKKPDHPYASPRGKRTKRNKR